MTVTTGALPSGTLAISDQVVGNQGGSTKRLTVSTVGLSDVEPPTNWTPTLYGATTAGTTTYSVQYGTYTKVGSIVTLNFTLFWTNATGTGGVRIGGLPYTARNYTGVQRYGLLIPYYNNLNIPSGKSIGGYLQDATNYISLLNFNETTGNDPTDLQTQLTITGELYGSITYIV